MTEKLYSRADISRELGVHPATVINWIIRGNLTIRPTYSDQHGKHTLYTQTDLDNIRTWYKEWKSTDD